MMRAALVWIVVAGCSGENVHHLPDAPPSSTIRIDPADVSVTITDGAAVAQAYTATLITPDGSESDVTSTATFTLRDPQYGEFSGPSLSVTGKGAGPTRVIASADGATGDTGLTVHVNSTIYDTGTSTTAGDLFDHATEDPTLAPTIAYPSDAILVPPNLGQFDVHWHNNAGNTDNLFRVEMSNDYVDVRIYTTGFDPTQPFWTVYQPDAWYPIASSKQQLTLTVAGLDSNNPASKGTAAAQHVDVTNENAQGGIYYWTTSGAAGIWRYDVGKPDVPPAPYFADTERPAGCMGCHSLSRDGTKIAMTYNGGNGPGAIFDVGTKTAIVNGTASWDFASFDSKAEKLVTIEGSHMFLRKLDGTMLAGPVAEMTAGSMTTHPEIAPDDQHVVAVEFTSGYDAQAFNGAIVTRTFDDATNTFGAPSVLVASDTTNQIANWYPSYSPDGQWIAYTRTTSYSYNDQTAETWVVKADGSLPPIQMTIADATGNLTNSWARWVPFPQTFGATNEPLFYLTFSSQRPFGVRIPGGFRPQIWMTPFFPSRALAGQDPSGPAFRVPFQDVTTANHIAQWTQAVVIQ